MQLHWLPVSERVQFKVLLLTCMAIQGLAPSYMSELDKCDIHTYIQYTHTVHTYSNFILSGYSAGLVLIVIRIMYSMAVQ